MSLCKIMIVDDIPGNVEAVKRMIKDLNFEVKEAFNGAEAIDLIESFKPHIVLLDLMMPEVDGWEVIKYIRSKYSKEEMVIIITSVLTNSDNIDECYELGANDYIAKPIIKNRLINSLKAQIQAAWGNQFHQQLNILAAQAV